MKKTVFSFFADGVLRAGGGRIAGMIFLVFFLSFPGVYAQIILKDGFESGKLDRSIWDVTWWTDHQLEDGIQPEIVTSPVRAGKYAVKMRIEYQWNGVEDYDRTELQGKRNDNGSHTSFFNPNGKEYWIGFSCYFPEEWAVDSKEELIFQLHGNGGGRSPSLALYIDGDEWYWYVRWQPDRDKPDETAGEKELWRAKYRKGVWTDWVIHAVFSFHEDGFLEFFKNDTSVVVYNGPNCYNDALWIRGPQTGIYKWPWMDGPTDVTERVIYLDEFAVGGEKSTYADVAPSTMVKADFGISAKDCSAEVSFVNTSSSKLGQIDSCLWDFGDGTTSRETSPVHIYASPGKYYITLTAYDSTFTSTEKDSIELYFAPKPADVSAKQNDDGTVTLTASGTGTINWYDVLSGGEIIGTGDTFTTSVTNTEVFYAENVIGGNMVSRGAKAGKGDVGDYYKWEDEMAVWGLEFDTKTQIVLKSVKVYNGESESGSYTGPRTFTVVTSSGDTVAQTTVDVTEGEQRLELNMSVPPGKGYRLFPDRHVGLWRDTDGAVFPYAVGPAVMITAGLRFDGLKPADRQGYYYFFYDWEVEAEMPVCHSARVGTDGTVGMKKTKDTAITLFPNPADDHLQIKGLPAPAKGSVQIYNSLCQLVKSADMRGDTQMEVNTGDLPPGMYFCRVVADGRLLCTKKVMIVR